MAPQRTQLHYNTGSKKYECQNSMGLAPHYRFELYSVNARINCSTQYELM